MGEAYIHTRFHRSDSLNDAGINDAARQFGFNRRVVGQRPLHISGDRNVFDILKERIIKCIAEETDAEITGDRVSEREIRPDTQYVAFEIAVKRVEETRWVKL